MVESFILVTIGNYEDPSNLDLNKILLVCQNKALRRFQFLNNLSRFTDTFNSMRWPVMSLLNILAYTVLEITIIFKFDQQGRVILFTTTVI